MRKSAVILFLLACFSPFASAQKIWLGQDQPMAKTVTDYPIQVHISGIHIRTHCGFAISSCEDKLYADATLNGKKVDLMGEVVPIPPEDYIARLAKKSPVPELQEIGQKYEVLSPDNTFWKCEVAGFSE